MNVSPSIVSALGDNTEWHLNLWVETLSFSLSNIVTAVRIYLIYSMLSYVSISLDSPELISWMDVVICQRPFLHLMKLSCHFYPWIFSVWSSTFLGSCLLYCPWISGIKPVISRKMILSCALEFYLLVFWEYFYNSVHQKFWLIISFLLLHTFGFSIRVIHWMNLDVFLLFLIQQTIWEVLLLVLWSWGWIFHSSPVALQLF